MTLAQALLLKAVIDVGAGIINAIVFAANRLNPDSMEGPYAATWGYDMNWDTWARGNVPEKTLPASLEPLRKKEPR
jgi:hypothetical protein